MANLKYHEEWLEHDGKECTIDGLKCRIQVRTGNAIYPYAHATISVHAEPINKNSKKYLEIKHHLGDDWSTDLLDSVELGWEVLNELQRTPDTVECGA